MEKILESIDEKVISLPSGNPRFSDSRYEFVSFSEKNLHPLEIPVESDKKIAFVDGGNHELISAPTFSIHLVRVYFNIFQGKEKIAPKKVPPRIEFYAATTTSLDPNGEIEYQVNFFPINENFKEFLPKTKDLFFNSYDETIKEGIQRGKITKLGEIARKFAEWNLIPSLASQELVKGDIIVRDGSLQTSYTNESKYSQKAYQACQKKEILLMGLSKTSSLYTTTGNSLIGVIHQLGKKHLQEKPWYYYPIVNIEHPDHQAEMYCLKLHSLSEYAFRLEILKTQAKELTKEELENYLGALSANSCDISFPGYPYGLIDADMNARVKGNELNYHTTLFLSEASKKNRWQQLINHIKATDAHHKLNKIIGK